MPFVAADPSTWPNPGDFTSLTAAQQAEARAAGMFGQALQDWQSSPEGGAPQPGIWSQFSAWAKANESAVTVLSVFLGGLGLFGLGASSGGRRR